MSSKKDYHILNSFSLKIIGMISMILDHIGVFYEMYHSSIPSYDINVQLVLRILGRISFIIFAFLTVEGVLHSKKPLLYLVKLLTLSLTCDIVFLIATKEYVGNPITTLFLGGLTIYLLKDRRWFIKLLSIVPLAFTLLIAFEFIPLKADYDIYGLITIILFYIGKILADIITKYVSTTYSLDEETFLNSSYYLTLRNMISSILFITFTLIVYFVNPIWNGKGLFSEIMFIQVYAIFGTIPLLFYNGKRGYNKAWFKYGCYGFFPLHIIIIYLIFNILL